MHWGREEGVRVGANKRQLCKVSFSLNETGSHWQTLSRREVLFHSRGKNTMVMSVLRKNAERYRRLIKGYFSDHLHVEWWKRGHRGAEWWNTGYILKGWVTIFEDERQKGVMGDSKVFGLRMERFLTNNWGGGYCQPSRLGYHWWWWWPLFSWSFMVKKNLSRVWPPK